MSKLLIIGDVHNHWVHAQSIIDKYKDTHKIILIGDYFDNFGDTALDAKQTATWLKETIHTDNVIALMGNHDIHYSPYSTVKSRTNTHQLYSCSGYSPAKDDIISTVLTDEDWRRIKIYHYENGWLFSHGGFHPFWIEHPILGTKIEHIQSLMEKAQHELEDKTFSAILGTAGRCRGGSARAGGILWMDHQQEAIPMRDIKQVYGHTPVRKGIDIYEDNGGINIDVDCGLEEVLEINEDGSYNIIKTSFDNFYNESERKLREEQQKILKQKYSSLGAYDDIYKNI
jgi:hypothetical protein